MSFFNRLFGREKDKPEPKSKKQTHTPLKKYYSFNETGNVMVSTTREGTDVLNEELRKMFLDMSIFFAAMTKAIVTNGDGTAKSNSIYNSDAITKILDQSEFFVKVRSENITVSSSDVGDKMAKELTERILGREFEEEKLNFSKGLFQSMIQSKEDDNDAGSIFFICEYILGLPMVSAVVIQLDDCEGKGTSLLEGKTVENEFRHMGEILDLKESSHTILREWDFDKNTYMFISPRSISNSNFPQLGEDQSYTQLVNIFKAHLDADV